LGGKCELRLSDAIKKRGLEELAEVVRVLFSNRTIVLFQNTDKGHIVLSSHGLPLQSGTQMRGDLQSILEKRYCANGGRWHLVPLSSKGKPFGSVAIYTGKDQSMLESLQETFPNLLSLYLSSLFDNLSRESLFNQAEERYKTILESLSSAIITCDVEGKIISCNGAAAKLYGWKREEILGKEIVTLLNPFSKKPFPVFLKRLQRHGIWRDTGITLRKDGGRFLQGFTLTLLKDANNKPRGLVAIVADITDNAHTTVKATQASSAGGKEIRMVLTDITEEKRLYEKFSQTEKLTAVGQLASGIAHDLNNFLTIILGNLHLAERQDLKDKELRGCLRTIKKAAMDGAETIRRIREFTHVRTDPTKFVPLKITHIIKEVMNYTKPRWKALSQAKGVAYRIRFLRADGEGLVQGNPSELKEVFLNVINNALDAMPKGGSLTINTFKEDGRVVVSIRDTGMGMSEEVQRKVFDPFFTTKGVEGSGLGMSVAYGIVTRHGGEIKVESREGMGTTVLVKLPSTCAPLQKKAARRLKGRPSLAKKGCEFL
jgi:PAS domain S-box-containing protein